MLTKTVFVFLYVPKFYSEKWVSIESQSSGRMHSTGVEWSPFLK